MMSGMAEALLVAAVRTPIGRHGGALATVRPDDLAALANDGEPTQMISADMLNQMDEPESSSG